MTIEDVQRIIADGEIDTVLIGVPDMDGVLRGKAVPADLFLADLPEGFAQCDVLFGWDIAEDLVDDLAFTGWHTGYPDILMVPDLRTFARVPWLPRTASVLADLTREDGQPVEIAPRRVLRRVLENVADDGYLAKSAVEFEFRVYRESPESLRSKAYENLEPISPGNFCYSLYRTDGDQEFLRTVRDQLRARGVPVEAYNREHGEGMYEMNLHHAESLRAADDALLFRSGAKEVARQMGLMATFMAKVRHGHDGTSGHLHLSLWRQGEPVFGGSHGAMNDVMRHFLGGLLATLPELMLMYAPFNNSYKRYVQGTWAPTTSTWAQDNRTAAVRVLLPEDKPAAARIELRVPGSDIHPYLAQAAALAAGMHGIRNRIEPPPPVTGSAYDGAALPLAHNLREAVDAFQASSTAREAFGAEFCDHYARSRIWEAEQYERHVSAWERARYLEMI